MATQRLPTPGSDAGNWGTVLNNYLKVAHDDTGGINVWTTSTRPTSPDLNATGVNTTANTLERWNGTVWESMLSSSLTLTSADNSVIVGGSGGTKDLSVNDSQVDFNSLQNKPTFGNVNSLTTALTVAGGTGAVKGSGMNLSIASLVGASSGSAGIAGLVPTPSAGDQNKYLAGDATWKSLPAGQSFGNLIGSPTGVVNVSGGVGAVSGSGTTVSVATMSGATSLVNGNVGLVPTPSAGDQNKYLAGDATWKSLPASGNLSSSTTALSVTGGTGAVNGAGVALSIAGLVGASSGSAGIAGLVPTPSAGDQNKYLAGDATWKTPPVAGAQNGLTVNSSQVVLGQAIGEVGNPATLSSTREIPTAGFNVFLSGTGKLGVGRNAGADPQTIIHVGNGQSIAGSIGTNSIILTPQIDTSNTIGNFSLLGGQTTIRASGVSSVSWGTSTQANGANSQAFGSSSVASGNQAHAEGTSSTASGTSSHAEGGASQATNQNAHAEGGGTTASGTSSHSEGSATTASGTAAHAQGSGTIASGNISFAGGATTTAQGYAQFVIGQYNSLQGSQTTFANSDLAFIIGNGDAGVTTRSNAYAVTWDGVHSFYSGYRTRTTDPGAALPGDLYYNSSLNRFRWFNGTVWASI